MSDIDDAMHVIRHKDKELNAADQRIAHLEAQLKAAQDFVPDSAHINALPDPLRRFIHDLETNADPAGTIREAICQRENAMALAIRVNELESQLAEKDREIATLTQLFCEAHQDFDHWPGGFGCPCCAAVGESNKVAEKDREIERLKHER